MLNLFDKPPYAAHGTLEPGRDRVERHRPGRGVRRAPADHDAAPASTLSGGNQQKVVLARELSRPLKLLVIAQPTRGLDVGSMEFVHRRIVAERDQGTAVIMVSTELDEVLGLADRIAVMYRGRIAAEVPAGTPAAQIGLLMAGSTLEQARASALPLSAAAVGEAGKAGAL